jgi:hypothetical protein
MISNPYSDRLAELGFKPHNENKPSYKYSSIETFKTILENSTPRIVRDAPQGISNPDNPASAMVFTVIKLN